MSNNSASDDNRDSEAQQQLAELRRIILGRDGEHAAQALKPQARQFVGDVLIEALHDKQRDGQSINHVVAPIVEKTVERSVANHSEQFTSILYPLVGSLVRKSVSAFLSQFIERTNDIIENALSPKGLKWRFQAWQAGVSYSQFVAAQTYVYKVEQVLLIHRDTGILLKSVAADVSQDNDADLISSMLSAISDFVADSFSPNVEEQHLGEIKTDDFTLLICNSPHALLVAAVTGTVPNHIRIDLQSALDEIHSLHRQELIDFSGDTLVFEGTDMMLRDRLSAQVKPEFEKKKRIPWFGWLAFVALIVGCAWWLFSIWQHADVKQRIMQLNNEPGILITELKSNDDGFSVTVLRDTASLELSDWLANNDLNDQRVHFDEQAFISVEPKIVQRKLTQLVADYPQLALTGDPVFSISGTLNWQDMRSFNTALAAVPGIDQLSVDRSRIGLSSISVIADEQPAIQRQLFEQLVGEISRVTVEFDVGESSLNETSIEDLAALSRMLEDAFEIGQKLGLTANLIIIGASDASGASSTNRRLSLARANTVKTALINQNISVDKLFATGIGEINLSSDAVATRRVMFNVMYAETKPAAQPQGQS